NHGTSSSLAFHLIELLDVDALLPAEQDHQDRKADRGLRCRHSHDEENVDLAVQITELACKSDEIEVHREQHELDAHEQQDHVLAVQEDARHAQREQQTGQQQDEFELDHASFSGAILTIRMRSCGRTATCAATSCCLKPRRLRIVNEIAAMMASSRSMAASSNGYR